VHPIEIRGRIKLRRCSSADTNRILHRAFRFHTSPRPQVGSDLRTACDEHGLTYVAGMGGAELRADRLQIEEAYLAQAEQDIADGQMRVTEQELRIAALRAGGRDTTQAERLLGNLRGSLVERQAHRAEILRLIRSLRKA
jgi:hypothetical protein